MQIQIQKALTSWGHTTSPIIHIIGYQHSHISQGSHCQRIHQTKVVFLKPAPWQVVRYFSCHGHGMECRMKVYGIFLKWFVCQKPGSIAFQHNYITLLHYNRTCGDVTEQSGSHRCTGQIALHQPPSSPHYISRNTTFQVILLHCSKQFHTTPHSMSFLQWGFILLLWEFCMKIPKIYPLNETHWKRASFNPLLQIWWWFICDCKAREDAWYWWMIDRPRCKHKSGRRRYISAESIHYLSFPPPQAVFVRKKLQSPKKSVRSEAAIHIHRKYPILVLSFAPKILSFFLGENIVKREKIGPMVLLNM